MPYDRKSNPKSLLLTSNDGTQSGRSGYDVLADYIENAVTIPVPRWSPRSFKDRLIRKFISIRAASSWHLLSSRDLETRAKAYLEKNPCDLVHMLWADRDWGLIDHICRQRGVPLVATVHACPDQLSLILNRPRRLLNPAAYILMSTHQKAFFQERGVPEERLHVVPHGIDIEHFQPVSLESNMIRILTVGSYRRNFDLLEQVIRELRNEPDIRFSIVSRRENRSRFEAFQNTEFSSDLSNAELRAEYQRATIFVMTALDATANNAMVEALACGLPVVCERVGGLPEYAPSSCAIHTAPNSVEEMVVALRELVADPLRRKQMGQAARQQAESLRWENTAKRMNAIYRQVFQSAGTLD